MIRLTKGRNCNVLDEVRERVLAIEQSKSCAIISVDSAEGDCCKGKGRRCGFEIAKECLITYVKIAAVSYNAQQVAADTRIRSSMCVRA